ncbi:Piriformospora indica-insensitive protein 2 [Linum grandiflorum]
MRRVFKVTRFILVICILLHLSSWCNGEAASDSSSSSSSSDGGGAPMESGEKAALFAAIQGFVGNWWNGSDLYPDPCGWTPIQGVSCDIFNGLWYVTALSIGPVHDNSLSCAPKVDFRPQLFKLKHLQSLSFFNCFITNHPVSIHPNDWKNLAANLEVLEFRSNPGLTGQVPASFGGLVNLKSLVLLENGLTGELPANVGNLKNLRRLVLAGNRFTGRIPESFGLLTKLLILDLSRNSLSSSLPFTFGSLTALLKLDLSNNHLQGALPMVIGNLKNLTLLDLRNNKISGGLTKSFEGMSSLEEMALSNNPLGGDLLGLQWGKLMSLAVLDLANVGLAGQIPNSIAELKSLRFLGLNDNNLTGDLPQELASMPSLSTLYLYGNNLTGFIKFPDVFIGKLGRRFGAWNNPELCYPLEIMSSSSNIPYGVKRC